MVFNLLALEKYMLVGKCRAKNFLRATCNAKKIIGKKTCSTLRRTQPKRLLFYNLSIHVAPNSTGEQLSRADFLVSPCMAGNGFDHATLVFEAVWKTVEMLHRFLEPIHVFLGTCCHASANSV